MENNYFYLFEIATVISHTVSEDNDDNKRIIRLFEKRVFNTDLNDRQKNKIMQQVLSKPGTRPVCRYFCKDP